MATFETQREAYYRLRAALEGITHNPERRKEYDRLIQEGNQWRDKAFAESGVQAYTPASETQQRELVASIPENRLV